MNRKERVWAAVSHEEGDRVPIHINAVKWVVAKLKRALGVETDRELLETLHADIYDMRGIDLHSGVVPAYIGPPNKFFHDGWGGDIFSFWGVEIFEKETSFGWLSEMGAPPLANAASIDELENYNWIKIEDFDFSNVAAELKQWNDFSIMASGGSVFQHATYLRGMDTLMMDMSLRPDMAHFLLDKMSDFYYDYFKRMFEVTGDMIDLFALADDFGMQNGLLISPKMFEKFVAPNLRRMAELAHSYNKKLLLHTCGKIETLIPRFIELGVDVLDPLQPECMNPIEIKEKYGKEICFRGGISVQNTVSRGTIQDVENEAKRITTALKKGGGYIFAPGHPVLHDDMPVENIIALYEAGYKYGQYKGNL